MKSSFQIYTMLACTIRQLQEQRSQLVEFESQQLGLSLLFHHRFLGKRCLLGRMEDTSQRLILSRIERDFRMKLMIHSCTMLACTIRRPLEQQYQLEEFGSQQL